MPVIHVNRFICQGIFGNQHGPSGQELELGDPTANQQTSLAEQKEF